LFGNKKTAEGEVAEDEIVEKDLDKKTGYLNLRIKGTLEDYEIEMSKKREKKE